MQYRPAIFLFIFGVFSIRGQAAGPSIAQREIDLARGEIERVQELVKSGAIPAVRLQMAQDKLADAEDDVVLERTLYGSLSAQDLSDAQTKEMMDAAERRVERSRVQVERLTNLMGEGAVARGPVAEMNDELRQRETALDLARDRARLFKEIEEAARQEQTTETAEAKGAASSPSMERFDGDGRFNAGDLPRIEAAFERKFAEPLPVSANGETAVHRAMGFDHRGKVDVALTPDGPEGAWLRQYLEARRIPYYAFRGAVPGKATGAHIHIGTGSTRSHAAD